MNYWRSHLILFVLSFSLFFSCGKSGPAPGETAPEITLTNLAGETVNLSDYRGKLVLLHFWTDWCDACRQEFPLMQEYYQELAGEEFELLAVNVGQEVSVSQTFHQDFNVTFPMCADVEMGVSNIYGVEQFPTNYLINPDGVIARRVVGWVDRTFIENVLYGIQRTTNTTAIKN